MLIQLSRNCVLSAWWSMSIDASVHPGTVGCNLLALNYSAMHFQVEWQLQDSSFCDMQWSLCVCGREAQRPLLTVHTSGSFTASFGEKRKLSL